MQYNYNKKLIKNAQELRKNMTPEEKHLWYDFLIYLPMTTHKQKNIGNYIVDFYIPKARLVIEVDGMQHREEHLEADRKRDFELKMLGNRIMRFSNFDIRVNFPIVCYDIMQALGIRESDLKKRKSH
jgi:very-short-patch-repair endonuclease